MRRLHQHSSPDRPLPCLGLTINHGVCDRLCVESEGAHAWCPQIVDLSSTQPYRQGSRSDHPWIDLLAASSLRSCENAVNMKAITSHDHHHVFLPGIGASRSLSLVRLPFKRSSSPVGGPRFATATSEALVLFTGSVLED